jgi:transposase
LYYSGKKKRHTLKTQVLVDLESKEILAIDHGKGRCHDFTLFKKSNIKLHPDLEAIADKGYQGLQKIHTKTRIPKKSSKKKPLSAEDKKINRKLNKERVVIEHIFGDIKVFKIISDKYRNRRKRFALRFSLIAGFYNVGLSC